MIYLLQAGLAGRLQAKQLGQSMNLWHPSFGVLCRLLGVVPYKTEISVSSTVPVGKREEVDASNMVSRARVLDLEGMSN